MSQRRPQECANCLQFFPENGENVEEIVFELIIENTPVNINDALSFIYNLSYLDLLLSKNYKEDVGSPSQTKVKEEKYHFDETMMALCPHCAKIFSSLYKLYVQFNQLRQSMDSCLAKKIVKLDSLLLRLISSSSLLLFGDEDNKDFKISSSHHHQVSKVRKNKNVISTTPSLSLQTDPRVILNRLKPHETLAATTTTTTYKNRRKFTKLPPLVQSEDDHDDDEAPAHVDTENQGQGSYEDYEMVQYDSDVEFNSDEGQNNSTSADENDDSDRGHHNDSSKDFKVDKNPPQPTTKKRRSKTSENNKKPKLPKSEKESKPKKTNECPICQKSEPTITALEAHCRNEHPGEAPYRCEICGSNLRSAVYLKRHMKVHDRLPLQCPRCKEKFATKHSAVYENHLKECTGVRRVSCQFCGDSFGHFMNLYVHMKIHKEALPCPSCDQAFPDQLKLNCHVKFRHGGTPEKKPHICSFCGTGFRRPAKLALHIRLHTGEKPCQCPICGRAFAREFTLQAHLLVHTKKEDKPFKCDLCPKTFNRSDLLRCHNLRVHQGLRPYLCDLCGKNFAHQKPSKNI